VCQYGYCGQIPCAWDFSGFPHFLYSTIHPSSPTRPEPKSSKGLSRSYSKIRPCSGG